ncbi:cyclic nucleotide-binding-like protein [Cantharellus anzutake]|uniref:cyclic nucleotide-binding-like protein n=1 Tax=Cantharellus anzutake TaxID=1750568 RepID=UPI001902EB62|nr:cyclic nucleotide-binding-like protein [Cantharellus anzutake]KAF8324418.1 cyclic nucleotide-binding-like protein [Cantharellus anzutake]
MNRYKYLIADLTRDVNRAQPRDALQFCANWLLPPTVQIRSRGHSAPGGLHHQSTSLPAQRPPGAVLPFSLPSRSVGPIDQSPQRPEAKSPPTIPPLRVDPPRRPSASPFGTLNVPGNAALPPSSGEPEPSHRQFLTIQEEDDGTGVVEHPAKPLNPLTKKKSNLGLSNGFLGPPPSALGRRVSVSAESISPSTGPERPPPFFLKTKEQMKRLEDAIRDAFLFRKLDTKKRNAVLGAMKEMHFGPNEPVITQGDDGDYFYVVDSGTLDVYKNDGDQGSQGTTSPDWHPVYGKKVFQYERGGTFGELALMYYAKRAATVITTSPCTLWALDRVTFQTILLDISARTRRSYEAFLASVPLLESLNDAERGKLADVLQSREYGDGEIVVKEGDVGNEFFIVEEGEALALKNIKSPSGGITQEIVKRYKRGDYFGELALLHRTPRAATVKAAVTNKQGPLKVAALDADAFTRLLGPLRDLMERSAAALYSNPLSHQQP